LFQPPYNGTTVKVGVKHQPINQTINQRTINGNGQRRI